MKKILNLLAVLLVCLAFDQTSVFASSHREAPLISNDPLADNTDLYAFKSPVDKNKIILVANYIPFEHPAGGPNWYTFGENIRYEIHVENNGTAGDDITYRFTFKQVNEDPSTFFNIRLGKQNLKTTYTLERSVNGGAFASIITNGSVPPPNIGPRSIENPTLGLNVPNYDTLMFRAIKTASTGERVFCGPVDDPFFVDLGGAFDVGGFRMTGRDGLAKFNCHSIVIEAPISTLQKEGKTLDKAANILDPDYVIGVWASASRPEITTFDASGGGNDGHSGNWIQVSRLGMPLTNEAVIPIGKKDKWNATLPDNDVQFASYFNNPELGLYMDDSKFGGAVPGLANLRIQSKSLGSFDFRNGHKGLYDLKGSAAVAGTALDEAAFGGVLLPDSMSPRAVDLLPIFYTGVPNLKPYQLATGKNGNPLAAGKPFINNFLPTLGDMLRLNMAVPATPRNDPKFSNLGIVGAAVLGLTDPAYNTTANLEFIPNMDGFPNGRRLEDDVTTIELQAVSGVALAAIGLWYDDYASPGSPVTPQLLKVLSFNAGVTENDTTFKPTFPFLQAPWRGFNGPQYSGPSGPLPVNWLSFTAERVGPSVQLKWEVDNEVNNDHYDIQYSTDATHYEKIGMRPAGKSGRITYYFTHATPSMDKINYYRIQQFDKDGKFSYSAVRSIKFSESKLLNVTPNPVSDVIRVYTNQALLNVNLYDFAGKKLATKIATNGYAEFKVSGYAKGIYVVAAEKNGVRLGVTRVAVQ